jgi:translation initiation factor IF-2
MAEEKMMRLRQVASRLNVGINTIAEHLTSRGFEVESNPNAKISEQQYQMLLKEFESSALDKKEASGLTIGKKHADNVVINAEKQQDKRQKDEEDDLFIKNFDPVHEKERAAEPRKEAIGREENKAEDDDDVIRVKLPGIKVLGKIDLDAKKEKKETSEPSSKAQAPQAAPVPVAKAPEAPVAEPKQEKPAVQAQEKPAPQPKEVAKPEPVKPEPVKDEVKPAAAVAPKPVEKAPQPVKAQEKPATVAAQEKPKEATKTVQPVKAEQPAPPAPAAADSAPEGRDDNKMDVVTAKADQLKGLTVLGKIELPVEKSKKQAKPVASSDTDKQKKSKRKRKRVRVGGEAGTGPQGAGENQTAQRPNVNQGDRKPFPKKEGVAGQGGPQGNRPQRPGGPAGPGQQRPGGPGQRPGGPGQQQGGGFQQRGAAGKGAPNKKFARPAEKTEVTDKEIQEQIKATLARLSGGKGGNQPNRAKYRREKRSAAADAMEERMLQEQQEAKILKVTEFVSASDLAVMMGVSVNEVISTCMSLGMFVSINQRLDAEAITIIADEFGYDVEFASAEEENTVVEEVEDAEEDMVPRAPIVTIMGHVDHGKTSLLDYIRRTKVTEQEAGGITQHIGAYSVKTDTGKLITFLDTPGHEAFTAMRARGAKVTDVVIIVIAADDNVMPQTKEAINHAQVAGVPIVIALNKVDKPNANTEKIREELAQLNILVEEWGGKYQSQEISAKTGQGVADLLEKVLLEAELLDLKAVADKRAVGTVIEASLDKGRGYVATMLVQSGTMHVGDVVLAGSHYGRVKAMTDHRGRKVKEAGPSSPVQVLGLDGAPQAGDRFRIMESEREAREIANRREQIQREQSLRTKKHITLDEIGRRLAIGSFKELNVIVKGDFDGSVEALSDSLLKLSTAEVQVRIIHKAVGQISESDVLLASASDAIIIGFQVRPSQNSRKLAEQEEIEIRLYSIIYDAINELKDAMEGMLAPKVEEVVTGSINVREVFKIAKIGTVAGCYVTEGNVKRNSKVRLVRDGIVVHTGEIDALKRFKDDVSEVKFGYECGISLKNFNDIQLNDTIEVFEQRETKRTL